MQREIFNQQNSSESPTKETSASASLRRLRGQMFSPGNNLSRGSSMPLSDIPPLPQFLRLEPITSTNQKYTRSGELRRVLGVPHGTTSEDHSFGVAQLKPPPPVATEELKHFKESIQDASRQARDRAKMLRESIFKLEKYKEALSTRKRQRSDLSFDERLVGSKLANVGNQNQRSFHDLTPQRLEDKARNIGLNKRVRTPVIDVWTDSRSIATLRQQAVTERSSDALQDVGNGSVRLEEKIRKLPAGSEVWDAKMKKKRSVAVVPNRALNADRDIKRATDPKLSADSKLRSCDMQGFRLKSSQGVSGLNKSDGAFETASTDSGILPKIEIESVPARKDHSAMLEKRVVAKASNKPNSYEINSASSPNSVVKGKISRAPRTSSIMSLDSSMKIQPSSGGFQGSSPHTIAQWGGQRPHKNSRTRRLNLVSPVSSNVESQFQGFPSSEFSSRTSPVGIGGSLLASTMDNNSLKIKVEIENVSSPFGLSESEESVAGESKAKEKGNDSREVALTNTQKVGAYMLSGKKNKVPNEIGDGVRRQGRSGRGLSSPSIQLEREKLENLPTTNPLQIMRPTSDKSKTKSGRPPTKKLKHHKAVTHVGQKQDGGSLDFAACSASLAGESEDDREDLFVAASSARNFCNISCSGPFWKKMESLFASISPEDMSYLKQQLHFAEQLDMCLSPICGGEFDFLGGVAQKEVPNFTGERSVGLYSEGLANKGSLCGSVDAGRFNKGTPLYQLVLSALIEEDESEEVYFQSEGKNAAFHYASDDSHCGSCNQIDMEPKDRERVDYETESKVDFQAQRNSRLDRFSCVRSASSSTLRNPSTSNSLISNGRWLGDDDYSHLDVGHVSEICSDDVGLLQLREVNTPHLSSSDCQYQLMSLDDRLQLELQSIGLCPEPLPDLAEGEDMIDQNIMQLNEGLYHQVGIKKKNLGEVIKAIQRERDLETRNIQQVAMDQLLEMAYRRRMACRGSNASRNGVRKVTRQVALAFVKRVLARCRKFEDTGISCFSEPGLHNVISAPLCNDDAKSVEYGSGTASNICNEVSDHYAEARGPDAFHSVEPTSVQASSKTSVLNRGRKREVLIDDVVGSASSRVASTFEGSPVGGIKARRNERDNLSSSVSGADGLSLNGSRSENRPKSKPRQQRHNVSTAGNKPGEAAQRALPSTGRVSSQSMANASDRTGDGSLSSCSIPQDSCKESMNPIDFVNLDGLDSVEALGSWLNFDEDGLQDHDSVGLEIPMDDLSELNMIM
ncbi:uncharacterized protein LOC120002747 isoform X2 [Tripterygium wilfordii]|uniref:uncharacterized protein LOC120002747 isoform X2 n=1 Tax=Tripterygium wilfordii TaxID=458696 RepID=UPI0018F81EEF|nr:uncharacterized protein LOC120002747 isoform X2 [Tripterygium wilfordii]